MNYKIKHGVNQRIKSVNPKYYSSSYLSRWSKKIFSALIPGELKSPKPPPKTIKKAGTVSFAKNPNIATKNSSKINVSVLYSPTSKHTESNRGFKNIDNAGST